MQPLFDRVLVQPLDKDEKTPGGLYVPGNVGERFVKGEVVSVGPGRYENGQLVPIELVLGDVVLYDSTYGHEVDTSDGKMVLLTHSEACLLKY